MTQKGLRPRSYSEQSKVTTLVTLAVCSLSPRPDRRIAQAGTRLSRRRTRQHRHGPQVGDEHQGGRRLPQQGGGHRLRRPRPRQPQDVRTAPSTPAQPVPRGSFARTLAAEPQLQPPPHRRARLTRALVLTAHPRAAQVGRSQQGENSLGDAPGRLHAHLIHVPDPWPQESRDRGQA